VNDKDVYPWQTPARVIEREFDPSRNSWYFRVQLPCGMVVAVSTLFKDAAAEMTVGREVVLQGHSRPARASYNGLMFNNVTVALPAEKGQVVRPLQSV